MKYFLISWFLFLSAIAGFSQVDSVKIDSNKVIQFSGIITQGDSLYGVPGAIVIEKSTGRGTTTNHIGYFNLPVVVGDSIKIAALGFKSKSLVIPYDTSDSYTIVIKLTQDTITLPEVNLYAFPSEKVFKELVVNMELEEREQFNNLDANFNQQTLNRIALTSSLDGAATNNYYLQQQTAVAERKVNAQTISLLNPFAWARFIKDVQEYKEKKEKEKKEATNNSSY